MQMILKSYQTKLRIVTDIIRQYIRIRTPLLIFRYIENHYYMWYNTFMKDYILLIFNVFLTVLGQILLKQGVTYVGRIDSFRELLSKFWQLILNPYVIGGVSIYGFTTFVWLVILSRIKLSIAYPMLSLGYVIAIPFSWLFFKESIPKVRIIGAIIICIGVYLVAQGET